MIGLGRCLETADSLRRGLMSPGFRSSIFLVNLSLWKRRNQRPQQNIVIIRS